MRRTLTLDDDVAAWLKAEARRTGRPFRDIVDKTLRRGLATRRVGSVQQPFKVVTRDLGNVRVGLSLDNIGELIEQLEGALRR